MGYAATGIAASNDPFLEDRLVRSFELIRRRNTPSRDGERQGAAVFDEAAEPRPHSLTTLPLVKLNVFRLKRLKVRSGSPPLSR